MYCRHGVKVWIFAQGYPFTIILCGYVDVSALFLVLSVTWGSVSFITGFFWAASAKCLLFYILSKFWLLQEICPDKLLQQAREINSKLNPKKIVVRASNIPFFGQVISKDGIKPNLKKVEAIIYMQPPTDEKLLANFLGLVNYLNRFYPYLVTLIKPLCNLMPKGSEFI